MLSYFNGVIIMHKDGKYIGYIYKILNTINDKLYIGQTTSSIEKRFNDHLSAARTMKSSSMIIIHAINKYGEESFSISEVEKVICDSQEELSNERELSLKHKNFILKGLIFRFERINTVMGFLSHVGVERDKFKIIH